MTYPTERDRVHQAMDSKFWPMKSSLRSDQVPERSILGGLSGLHRWRTILCACVLITLWTTIAKSQDESQPNPIGASEALDAPPSSEVEQVAAGESSGTEVVDQEGLVDGPNLLSFSFNGAPWREVLNWLADESGLALHVSELPAGSFTYSDPERFTIEDAISRLNLFLIPQGYTVVRRGKLLSVITLGDPRSMQQLDAMAELVSVEELDERSPNEVVKCMFALGQMDPEQASAELQPLMLMSSPVVLPKSNQLLIVDTVSKLRNVATVLGAMTKEVEEQTVVKRIKLKYTDFETVVLVAGSHLGLEQGETESVNLSLSTDLAGTSLFVSGTESQVEKLESLLSVIDVSEETEEVPRDLVLKSHAVAAGNLESVYEVLLTILNDRDIRLSMEPKTASIVALAEPAIHQQIENTIEELKAPAVEFAVIDLQTLDPYFAITLLGEMFGEEPETSERDYRRRYRYNDDDDDDDKVSPPKIDADPENRRLFIRGTKEQIQQAQQIIASLDGTKGVGEEIRVIPMRGNEGQQVLEAAKRAWDGRNSVVVLPPAESEAGKIIERAINPDSPRTADGSKARSNNAEESQELRKPEISVDDPDEIVTGVRSTTVESPFRDAADLVSVAERENEHDGDTAAEGSTGGDLINRELNGRHRSRATIRSQLTPEGIVIQSNDLEALDDFENILRSLGSAGKPTVSAPVAYYLKYVSAEEAVRMLADLLDGENALMSSPSGSLVNGGNISSSGDGYYGSLLFTREGRTTVSAGSATIVSDARLNRLIVQGTTADIEMVEKYLKLIDKGEGLTAIETFGKSHVVELVHSKAEDVAEVIRGAYQGRILGEEGGQPQGGQRQDPRADRREDDRRDEDEENRRTPVEKPTRGRQAEMTLAVHEASNSLIITAPDPLFAEVERLIQSVDTKSEQVIQVIPAGDGVDLESIMQRVMGVEVAPGGRNTRNNRTPSNDRGNDRRRR